MNLNLNPQRDVQTRTDKIQPLKFPFFLWPIAALLASSNLAQAPAAPSRPILVKACAMAPKVSKPVRLVMENQVWQYQTLTDFQVHSFIHWFSFWDAYTVTSHCASRQGRES